MSRRVRMAAVLIATLATLYAAEAPNVLRAPAFADYPFDQWAAAPEHAAIKWDVNLLPPQLSVHQRLIERIQAVIPGRELEKRRGRGELVLLARFEDSDGRQWRTGSRLNLVNVQEGVKSDELTFTAAAFVRPGDYRVQVALIDTRTMEHSFTRRTLHVSPLKSDPLPQAWLGLPSIEVLPAVDVPDAWFLPNVKGLLQLPIGTPENDNLSHVVAYTGPGGRKSTKQPPFIQLLVNTTPSEQSANSASSLRRNMSAVIPAFKVLSGLNANVQPPSAAVIDLTRHRVGFETANASTLDWATLGKVLTDTRPGIIDAKALAGQSSMREYFAREVARRAGESGPARWLIVMSGPLMFSHQDETPLPELAPDSNRHIVYLRFSSGFGNGMPGSNSPLLFPDVQIAPPRRVHGPMPGFATVLPGAPGRGRAMVDSTFPDDLERVLKPMGAQIVSVTNPDVFRKTVASLIQEISAN